MANYHTWTEPREVPDQTDWLVNDIYREGNLEALEAEQERGHDWYVPLKGVVYGMGGRHV